MSDSIDFAIAPKTTLSTVEYSTYFGTWSKGQYKGMSMIGVTNPDGAPNSLFNLFLWSKGAWPRRGQTRRWTG